MRILSVVVGKGPVKGHTGRVSHMCSLYWCCIPAELHRVEEAVVTGLGSYHIFLLPGLAVAAAMGLNTLLLGAEEHHPTAAVVAEPG